MIEIKNLSKQFEGFQAVENLSLRIETGEFFALLGPNGAGKTTTISMISTLLLPSGGEIYIDGERLTRQRKDIKRKVSVVTQEYSMRQDMNMDEIMEYIEEAQALCDRVALMDGGKLEDLDTPENLICKLGAYAVDEMHPDGVHSSYFTERSQAIAYLSELTGNCTLRDTTLEDVFVEQAGKHLTKGI